MKSFLILSVIMLGTFMLNSQSIPFPNHTQYKGVFIKPSLSQQQLDSDVTTFYDLWKAKYLVNGCASNQYYIFFDSGNTITVSEAMGYGFMIIPLMAGYDPIAQTYFNGLYRYYRAHPSSIMPRLMAWKQITNCVDADGPDSATDGDVDIAFGLLLAHAQWGSAGTINYLQEAKLIIADIMGANKIEGDINQDLNSVKLGDWVKSGSRMNATRTSDFVMDHFRVFAYASQDTTWNNVVDQCYNLIDSMQTNYSPSTGLLPDFIVNVNTNPAPAPPNFLEEPTDGDYSYNACRDPWRMASDYLINGEVRAQVATKKIASWLKTSANGNIYKVYAGYHLNGVKMATWTDNSFTAPFAVGAMLDTANQAWLNTLYGNIKTFYNNGGYYDNTLTLLSLITISGNYWVPDTALTAGFLDLKRDLKKDIFKVKNSLIDNQLEIQVNNFQDIDKYEFQLIDIVGRNVWQEKTMQNQLTKVNTSHFQNGMYVIYAINKENGQIIDSEKFIISR